MAIVEQFVLLSFGLATIAVRVGVRWHQVGVLNWKLDDYLMPLTGIVFTLEVVAAYLVGAEFQGLTNSYMTDAERALLDPVSREYFNRVWGSKIQVIGWSLYVFILWALKFCVTAFYSRLTSGLTHLRTRVRIAYVLLIITYLTVALTLLLSCQPMHNFWQVNPDPGTLCRPTNSPAYVLVVVIPNVLTDIYLLSIPLPLVWGVNISLRRRLTLMFLFSGAVFVVMAATIRAVVISTSGPEGAVSGSSWACRETFVAIVVTNLPIIQPLIRKAANKIGLSTLFTRSSPTAAESYQLDSNPAGTNGCGSHFNTRREKGAAPHPLSIPQATAWGSDEYILHDGLDGNSAEAKDGDCTECV
ncbi:hypothetical protein VD0004_g2640 [Verticillium dahliae]|uniref:Rhodopsin domain-containing protein n=1 Tax=Verticillium dahliae TaxID=27337 RepID=A0A444S724_VERDA|nr:hypothetical protein VD0004_g2640 [Verticillium dahliae]RXG49202.1 hypothetical protein VDGE_08504 [Verticillium dahliae]